jgi:hypothetical protein
MQEQTHSSISTLHKAVLLLVATAAVGLLPLAAQAQCKAGTRPNTTKNEFRRSQLVVMGQVTETVVHVSANDPTLVDNTDYTFKVDRQLKGKRVSSLVINSKNTDARFPMAENRRYLLFVLLGKDNKWYVDNCGNSAHMARKG